MHEDTALGERIALRNLLVICQILIRHERGSTLVRTNWESRGIVADDIDDLQKGVHSTVLMYGVHHSSDAPCTLLRQILTSEVVRSIALTEICHYL